MNMTDLLDHRYKILEELGSGGSGQTFLAQDTYMPSWPKCVVKQFKPTASNARFYNILKERFDLEAAILEKLGRDHDQIPKLQAYFAENREFYLVQDWINGRTLAEEYRYKGAPTKEALCKLLSSLLSVLEFVHGRGVIHRDIKPANIMIRTSDGEPVLIDFGAVKEVVTASRDADGNVTKSVTIGTPGYMPLEQIDGHPVFSSDLYSLGLTAIFLLTGKDPNEMRDPATGELRWHQHAPDLDPVLASILDKATATLVADRYKSAQEMNEAIRPLIHKKITIPIPPGPVPPAPVPPVPVKTQRTLLYLAGGIVLLLLLGGVMVTAYVYRNGVANMNTNNGSGKPAESSCVLYNDDPSHQTVYVRADCDRKSCDQDESTIIGEYPNNTPIRVNREITVKARKNFSWVKIVLMESGQTGWIASSKYRCH